MLRYFRFGVGVRGEWLEATTDGTAPKSTQIIRESKGQRRIDGDARAHQLLEVLRTICVRLVSAGGVDFRRLSYRLSADHIPGDIATHQSVATKS